MQECGRYGTTRCLVKVGFAPWEQQDPHARLLAHASFLQTWVDGRDPGSCQGNADDEAADFEESDDQSLLQVAWPGAEALAFGRLPPPGNPVRFQSWVEADDDELCGGFHDPRCDNDFWLDFVQGIEATNNSSAKAMLKPGVGATIAERVSPSPRSHETPNEPVRKEEVHLYEVLCQHSHDFVASLVAKLDMEAHHNPFMTGFCQALKAASFQETHEWVAPCDWDCASDATDNWRPIQADELEDNCNMSLFLEERLGTSFAPCAK